MLKLSPAVNEMARETSPYLLQHRDNPVQWQRWGEAAFARARAEGKPVMLSIGYAACHWCHVMARESFENPGIAAEINRLVVPVKVDREERPDLDQIYQNALAAMNQSGGWPLTMFLTPDRVPFWGGTYFPPKPRYGRAGILEVLTQIAASYRDRPESVARAAASLGSRLAAINAEVSQGAIGPGLARGVAERLSRLVDPVFGGIGEAPKFPHCPVFELLWRACLRTGDSRYRNAVVLTLTRMSQGGLYDHLGGGFARYSTDPEWLVPHFEKMLYDNAQLIDLLTLVWQDTSAPLFADRVAETVAWLLREMVTADGAFAGTLDADSEHHEGRYYVWSVEEIDRVLGVDGPWFRAVYDVAPGGNWEGASILNRRHTPDYGDAADETRLRELRRRLLTVRTARVPPARDDKVLADWNGLAIAALARAGLAFERPDWVNAAEVAFARVCALLGTGDRLCHSWCAGRAGYPGTLDDYAAMIGAALALHEASGRSELIERARHWQGVVDRHFWDGAHGGYFFTADDAEPTIVRPRIAHDTATPSGNALMVGGLARLFHLTGDVVFRERAEAVIGAFSGGLAHNALALATLLNQADGLERALVVTLTGPAEDAGTTALRRAVTRLSLPDRVLVPVIPEDDQGQRLPPHAIICAGQSCSPPHTEAETLRAALLLARSGGENVSREILGG